MRDFWGYIYTFMRDFLLCYQVRRVSMSAFHCSIIQVFQFTCCSDLVAFKFQVNKKAQNHISVYLQECVFESFHILLLEQQYRCGVEYFRSHSVYCIVHQLVELVIMTGLFLRVKLLYLLVVELCPFLCPSEELLIYWFQVMFVASLFEFQEVSDLCFHVSMLYSGIHQFCESYRRDGAFVR